MFKSLPVLAAGRRHLAALWLTVVAAAFVSGYLFAAGVLHRARAPAMSRVPVPALARVPVPAITRHPAAVTRSGTAAFGYADGDRAAGFSCSLDGGAFTRCPRGGVAYRALSLGRHRFAVRAGRGRWLSGPARYAWQVVTAHR